MLKNKEGLWMSDEEWIFKMQNDSNDSIYIKNINSSKTKVLESSGDGKVDLEKQLWKKGKNEAKDYYTLKNQTKVLTAIIDKTKPLQMQGNIPLKWIIPNC